MTEINPVPAPSKREMWRAMCAATKTYLKNKRFFYVSVSYEWDNVRKVMVRVNHGPFVKAVPNG